MRNEELYYIQDARQYIGNAVLWWGKNSGGYTTDITKAEKYTKDQAKQICRRKTDKAWLCSHVDKHITQCVDMQYLDGKFSRAWRGRAK